MKTSASTMMVSVLLSAYAANAAAEQYEYDPQGRLTAVLYDDNTFIRYTYDAMGNMLRKATAAPGTADLRVTVVPDPTPAVLGEMLTLTISIQNMGPDAVTDAALDLFFQSPVDQVHARPSQGACAGSSDVTCAVGRMLSGEVATIIITADPMDFMDVTLDVTVNSSTQDPLLANNHVALVLPVVDGDLDGDGARNSGELVDANGDGTPDHRQPGVATLPGFPVITVVASGGCGALTGVQRRDASTLPVDTFEYPVGLVAFTLPCDTGTVTVLHHVGPLTMEAEVRAFGPTAPGGFNQDWAGVAGGQVTTVMLDGEPSAATVLQLTDNVSPDGTALDGFIIVAAVGPGVPRVGPPPIPEIAWSGYDGSLGLFDQEGGVAVLPFTFHWFGQEVSELGISNRGLIQPLRPTQSCTVCDRMNGPQVRDNDACEALGIDCIFMANSSEMYSHVVVEAGEHQLDVLFVGSYLGGGKSAFEGVMMSVTFFDDDRVQWKWFKNSSVGGQGTSLLYSVSPNFDLRDDVTIQDGFAMELDPIAHQIHEIPWNPMEVGIGMGGTVQTADVTLPTVFPYFGLDVTTVHASAHGYLEMLPDGESCVACTGERVHESGEYATAGANALFAANGELAAGMVARLGPNGFEFVWVGPTAADSGDFENQGFGSSVAVAVNLRDDGVTTWRFWDMNYNLPGADLFSGLYFAGTEWEQEIEGGSLNVVGPQVARAFELVPPPNLSITNTPSMASVVNGRDVSLVAEVTNLGPPTALARVVYSLPPGLTGMSTTSPMGACVLAGGVADCTFSDVEAHGVRVVTVVARATMTGMLLTQATVSGNLPDYDPDDNTAQAHVTVVPDADAADLELSMTGGADPIAVGQVATRHVNVINHGLAQATGIVVECDIPANAAFASATPSTGTCMQQGAVVHCDLANLGITGQATVDISLTALAPGDLTTEARVSAMETDPEPLNNNATVTTRVLEPPDAGVDAGAADAAVADAATVDAAVGDAGVADGSAAESDAGAVPPPDDTKRPDRCSCDAAGMPRGADAGPALLLLLALRRARKRTRYSAV